MLALYVASSNTLGSSLLWTSVASDPCRSRSRDFSRDLSSDVLLSALVVEFVLDDNIENLLRRLVKRWLSGSLMFVRGRRMGRHALNIPIAV